MFVSRGSRGNDANRSRVVLIELDHSTRIDKAVLPAAIEFVVQDVIASRSGFDDSTKPDVALLCTDRDPREFERMRQLCSIPISSVVDGFSEWFSLGEVRKLARAEKQRTQHRHVHIGDVHPTARTGGSVLQELKEVLKSSACRHSEEKIVVIDSISSILHIYADINCVLDLKYSLLSACKEYTSGCSVTLICTFQNLKAQSIELQALKKLADTHILLRQGLKDGDHSMLKAHRDIITITVCRVRESGRVQLEDLTLRMDWVEQKASIAYPLEETASSKMSASKTEQDRLYQESVLRDLGLSFRVGLSASERELRATVGLPYLHRDEALADSALQLHPRELQVGYQPDNPEDESETDSDEELFSEDV